MKTLMALVCLLVLIGCTMKAEFSVMKKWDRPAERTVSEDTSELVKQPPRTTIETQDPIVVTPSPSREIPPPTVPQMKPMDYEVPPVIFPEKAAPIQYMFLHKHKDNKRACYVRTTLGVYVSNHLP